MTEGDPETPAQPPAPRFWKWMGICLLFVGPATLCLGDAMAIIGFTLFFGWIPVVAQIVVWSAARTNKWSNYLCLLVPAVATFWLVFEQSSFYGRPRWVIGRALKEPAPLVFWPLEFSEDVWTDYVARLRVRLDKNYLRNALEKHFERRQFLEGMPHTYYLKNAEVVEGVVCSVETDAQFSYAFITYSVD